MLKDMVTRFSDEGDGGDEMTAVGRLKKIRKWMMIVSILAYLIRTNQFPIKDVHLPFMTFDPLSSELVVFWLGLATYYLLIHFVINVYLYMTVERLRKLIKLRELAADQDEIRSRYADDNDAVRPFDLLPSRLMRGETLIDLLRFGVPLIVVLFCWYG